ncbi:hypothetical protein ACJU26_09515 [Acidithiobacillus sp. M4-SHS-6]|uniref:hypothetical protein n=1 Tax=Acidithiobacillus sp. M4-SHS-6 TaxID=3383024 RepID=UPI0039BE78F8
MHYDKTVQPAFLKRIHDRADARKAAEEKEKRRLLILAALTGAQIALELTRPRKVAKKSLWDKIEDTVFPL